MNNNTTTTMDILHEILDKYKSEKKTVIGLLQDINKTYQYLPEDVLEQVSDELEIPLAKLYGIATFYKSLRMKPVGRVHIYICTGTTCHVHGAQKLVDYLTLHLGIKEGEITEDGKFSFETVNCLGACALGPLVVFDGKSIGKMDQDKLKKIVRKYERNTD